MTQIKDIFKKKLAEEMRVYGYNVRALSAYTLLTELRIEDFLNLKDLPNREEIKRLAKALHIEEPILRVAVENSNPDASNNILPDLDMDEIRKRTKANMKPRVINTPEATKPKPIIKSKPSKATIATKIATKGPGRLTDEEAEIFQARFTDTLSKPNKREVLKAMGLTAVAVHNYKYGKQVPYRKRAVKLMAIMNKLNPVEIDINEIEFKFRSALGYAIDRSGSVNKVASFLGRDSKTVAKWHTGKLRPSAKNMLEYTDRLNRFRKVENTPEARVIDKPVIARPIIKAQPKNETPEIDYSSPLVSEFGSPRLRTIERKRFKTCVETVINKHGKVKTARILHVKESRLDLYMDLARTVARSEAFKMLKILQPLARVKGIKLKRGLSTFSGKFKCTKFDIVRKLEVESDKDENKILTVIDYSGNRRPLIDVLNEINQIKGSALCRYNVELFTNIENQPKLQNVTVDSLDEVIDFILNYAKTADSIDIKLTTTSMFNDILMSNVLRYIQVSAV